VEAVVLCGIQGSGKSTLYVQRFFNTHVRISRDLLKTPHREARLLDLCVATKQPFAVDKVNATPDDRAPYVRAGRHAGFRTSAWFVDVQAPEAIARNARREERWKVPAEEILETKNGFVEPMLEEGFDEVWLAWADGDGAFRVERRAVAADAPTPGQAGDGERFTKRAAARR
jgi:AAA domain